MKTLFILCCMCLLLSSCRRVFDAPVPDTRWDQFDAPGAQPLSSFTRSGLQGIYTIDGGSETFGNEAAARWSYTYLDRDTIYHLSFFCSRQAAYFILEGRRVDTAILLNGYWRKPINTETGRVRLMVTAGGAALLDSNVHNGTAISLTGSYGFGEELPVLPLQLQWERELPDDQNFQILAHRGGGRTADLLPASENSVEIIRLASQFGATGIEIDVRMTKDKVPVIFHDATLNERVIQKNGLVGPIENYSYDQLNTLVRLSGGEKIPTLQEALHTVLFETPLRMVWLDTKFTGAIDAVRQIQQSYNQQAVTMNRRLTVYIGIPDAGVFENFLKLPNYQSVPSVCELDPDKTLQANSQWWAPQWTSGLQKEETERLHAAGKKVVPWTLDIDENIQEYMLVGNFDAILTNYPSSVAYYFYATH